MTTEREHRAQLAWWVEHSTPETADAIRWLLSALDSARADGVKSAASLDRTGEERCESYVYLASPYSDPDHTVMEDRFRVVCRVAAELMRKGELIFSPIAHTHPIAVAGELPRGWDFWCKYDEVMVGHAAKLLVLRLPGWERSKGIAAEIAIAERCGVPVEYLDADAAARRDAGDGAAAQPFCSPAASPTGDTRRAADITLGVPPYQHQPPKPEPGDAEWGEGPSSPTPPEPAGGFDVVAFRFRISEARALLHSEAHFNSAMWLEQQACAALAEIERLTHTSEGRQAYAETLEREIAERDAEIASLRSELEAAKAPPTTAEGGFDVEAARRQYERLWTVLGIEPSHYSLYPAALKEVERLTARAEAAEHQLADCRVMHAGAVSLQHGAEDRVAELERQLAEARGALKAVSEDSTDNVTYGLKCSLTRCRGCDRKRKMAAEAWHSSAPAQPAQEEAK